MWLWELGCQTLDTLKWRLILSSPPLRLYVFHQTTHSRSGVVLQEDDHSHCQNVTIDLIHNIKRTFHQITPERQNWGGQDGYGMQNACKREKLGYKHINRWRQESRLVGKRRRRNRRNKRKRNRWMRRNGYWWRRSKWIWKKGRMIRWIRKR